MVFLVTIAAAIIGRPRTMLYVCARPTLVKREFLLQARHHHRIPPKNINSSLLALALALALGVDRSGRAGPAFSLKRTILTRRLNLVVCSKHTKKKRGKNKNKTKQQQRKPPQDVYSPPTNPSIGANVDVLRTLLFVGEL